MSDEPLSLVIGAGGLLGSAIVGELQRHGSHFAVGESFYWDDPKLLSGQFTRGVDALRAAARSYGRPWAIYWCAGAGHVSASSEVNERDTSVLQLLLDAVDPAEGERGVIAFASSAGAVYAGNRRWPANEATPVAPIHAYGHAKVLQEEAVRSKVRSSATLSAVNLRISNLYGARQAMDKPQGLLSHLIANTFRGSPSMIYVPLDTSRDYLYVDDAARLAFRAVSALAPAGDGRCETRILASETNHTVAQLIGLLGRVMKRRVPTLARATEYTELQPPLLAFRSLDGAQRQLVKVSMEEGIQRLVSQYASRPVRRPRRYNQPA